MTDAHDGKTPREGLDEAYADPDFKVWAKNVQENMAPKMLESALVAPLFTGGEPDVKFAVEIGYSLLLDKPLVLCTTKGAVVPERLARAADAIIELDLEDARASAEKLQEEIQRLVAEGVIPA